MPPGERLAAALRSPGPHALPALIPYVTLGFPARNDTVRVLLALQGSGCAAAEIGIPFSDPLADGPTVQRASMQALRNGVTPALAIEQVAAARQSGVTMPLLFMTYVNLVLSHGVTRFCAESAAAGIDGLLLPDLPDDEAAGVRAAAEAHGLALVPLLAPTTTDERIARACAHAAGFVYCVSVTGVTGARSTITAEAFSLLDRVRQATTLPRAIGFGLSRHEHLEALRGRCEAAAVGSALLDAMAARPSQPDVAAADFVRAMLGTV